MANVKITDLTAYTDPLNTDVLAIVDVTNNVTKKVSIANMAKNVSLGTAALPGVAFDGDPNTGIYSPGADQVAISTNGTGRLFVDASGNVGIATSNPTSILQGTISSSSTGLAISTSLPTIALDDSSGTTGTSFWGQFDATTYFYNKANGPLLFGTNNTERLRITSAGLVGIGTSSPVSKINSVISQADNAVASDTTLANSFLHLGGGEYGLNRYFLTTYGYSTGRTNSGAFIGAIGASASGFGKYDLVFGTRDVTTDTAPDTRMIIKTDGKVGIGTTSPTGNLHVVGVSGTSIIRAVGADGEGNADVEIFSTGSTGNSRLYFSDTAAQSGSIIYSHNTNSLVFGTAGSEKARIDSSGRLLVGTPDARTNIDYALGTTGSQLQIEQANAATNFSIVQNFDSATIGAPATFTLARSGATSLGSTTIVANNNRVGEINFSGSDGTDFTVAACIRGEVDGTPGANDMPGRLVFSTTADGAASPTERMRITQDGRFAFGGQGAPYSAATCDTYNNLTGNFTHVFRQDHVSGYGLGVGVDGTYLAYFYSDKDLSGAPVGSISQNGSATAYNTSSDYRLKENISLLPNAIVRLLELKPSRFNFISHPDRTVDGFIAHEVQAIVPEAINGEKDEVDDDGNPVYQGIDQSKLVPLLTAALQEAIAKIESLEARLTAAGIA